MIEINRKSKDLFAGNLSSDKVNDLKPGSPGAVGSPEL
jgi:hypothetical protein